MIRHFISTSNFTGFFEIFDLIFHDHVRLRIFHLMHELSSIYHEVNLMKLIRSFYCCLRTPLFLSSCLQCVCVSKKQQKDLIPSSGTKGSFCRAIKAFSGLFATLKNLSSAITSQGEALSLELFIQLFSFSLIVRRISHIFLSFPESSATPSPSHHILYPQLVKPCGPPLCRYSWVKFSRFSPCLIV